MGFKSKSSWGATVFAALIAAVVVSSAHRRSVDITGDPVSGSAAVRPQAMLMSPTLDPAVHPAGDPLLGWKWSVSRQLIMPVAGVDPTDLVDTFAQIRGPDRRHDGIDIRAVRGTPVVAVTDGEILRLTDHDSGGITLYLRAPDGRTVFYYAHLLRYADGVRAGIAVRQGDVIGYVGDTGNAGPGNYHLHFEVLTMPVPQQYHAARPHNPYPLLLRARG
ncbi:MAG: M23 family metallopeptidase [Gemmatimonadetes bacterium]|nr:M23 family metallopeptidase [Gemmatimonadota bacterium]